MTVTVCLLLLAIAVGWLSNRLRIPYQILLVLAGISVGVLPFARSLSIEPELLLATALPAALYSTALESSWRDFRRNLRPILLLAIGFVLVTTVSVGAVLKALVPQVPWPLAFAFGAIVSPPDAIAATSILQRFRLPRRITTILEGESLVNDASGLVFYRFALAAALTGAFSLGSLAGRFALIATGGIVLGIAVGWVTSRIQERLQDTMLEIAMSLTTPFLAYLLCETVHVSGVLGVVAAGLYRARWGHKRASPQARLNILPMWGTILFLANCFVFFYLGLAWPRTVSALVDGASGFSWPELLSLGIALGLVVIGVRFVWVFAATYLPRWLSTRLRARYPYPPVSHSVVVAWSGMRGIVSLAAALALPVQLRDGTPFPLRELLVYLTYCVILITLVGQGLTLPALIRALGVQEDHTDDDEEAVAREQMRRAALRRIDRLVKEARVPANAAMGVTLFLAAGPHKPGGDGDARRLSGEDELWANALIAQREELLKLWLDEKIGDGALRRLERELDLTAARVAYQEA
jgi:Na+/H+ antiporter